MRKILLAALFLILIWAGTMVAKPAPDYFISNYDIMDLDFLRTHYTEINNERAIQVTGRFESYQWLQPYRYEERIREAGLDPKAFNILQVTLKEEDDFHYSFPILLIHTQAGDLQELDGVKKGTQMVIFGKFYNLKKSEFALDTDLIELANVRYRVNIQGTPGWENWGHDRSILLDARIPLSPTPTFTTTATPPPSLWQKVNNWVNPKETGTPTGTTTPGT